MCISIIQGYILNLLFNLLYSSAEWHLVYATYILGVATLFLGIVALFGREWAIRNLYVPKLEIFFENLSRGESKFCHKTTFGNSEPVYYFRFQVKNTGKSQAKECEVVLENLWVPGSTGNPEKFQRFLPENLNTVPDFVGKEQFIDLNPRRSFYCDIGHISRDNHGKNCQDIPGYSGDERRFWLDLLHYYNFQPSCLVPRNGEKYFMQYGLYSENAGYQKVCFSLSWSGNWPINSEDMYREIVIERVNCPNDA